MDSAAGLSRATYLGALAVDLADGAASAEVHEGGHIEVEGLLLALGVAHTRKVAVDVEKVVPVGLAPKTAGTCVCNRKVVGKGGRKVVGRWWEGSRLWLEGGRMVQ